jgi:hypothetical protein
MRVSVIAATLLLLCSPAFLRPAGVSEVAAGPGSAPKIQSSNGRSCRRTAIEGEVSAGQSFEKDLGGGLKLMLESLASGWILRVLPASGPRGAHDYAELATPPYQSVSPLLISTDFSFRAQDALAWNPRRFHFATSAAEFSRLRATYDEYSRSATPSAKAQSNLAELTALTSEGELQILDARLVPGTANQAQTAAMVASHFATTPHSVDQTANGRGTPLGQITWMQFRVNLKLPASFQPRQGLTTEQVPCS